MNRLRIYRMILYLGAALFVIGALFKIQHWPFAKPITVSGLVLIAVFSILFYSSKMEKSIFDRIAIVLLPLWSVNALSRILHTPKKYDPLISIVVVVLAFAYYGYHVYKWYREDKANGITKPNFARIGYVSGLILITVGLILKISMIPNAGVCISVGLVISIVSFLVSVFSNKSEKQGG